MSVLPTNRELQCAPLHLGVTQALSPGGTIRCILVAVCGIVGQKLSADPKYVNWVLLKNTGLVCIYFWQGRRAIVDSGLTLLSPVNSRGLWATSLSSHGKCRPTAMAQPVRNKVSSGAKNCTVALGETN